VNKNLHLARLTLHFEFFYLSIRHLCESEKSLKTSKNCFQIKNKSQTSGTRLIKKKTYDKFFLDCLDQKKIFSKKNKNTFSVIRVSNPQKFKKSAFKILQLCAKIGFSFFYRRVTFSFYLLFSSGGTKFTNLGDPTKWGLGTLYGGFLERRGIT